MKFIMFLAIQLFQPCLIITGTVFNPHSSATTYNTAFCSHRQFISSTETAQFAKLHTCILVLSVAPLRSGRQQAGTIQLRHSGLDRLRWRGARLGNWSDTPTHFSPNGLAHTPTNRRGLVHAWTHSALGSLLWSAAAWLQSCLCKRTAPARSPGF